MSFFRAKSQAAKREDTIHGTRTNGFDESPKGKPSLWQPEGCALGHLTLTKGQWANCPEDRCSLVQGPASLEKVTTPLHSSVFSLEE